MAKPIVRPSVRRRIVSLLLACGAAALAGAALRVEAQPKPKPPAASCGIIGCAEHGQGRMVSQKIGARELVVEFEVGSRNGAPFAHERVTLAPELLRKGELLIVTYNAKFERLAARIPGGLGAFWELDLQNEEGRLLRSAHLELGGKPLAPASADGRGAQFKVGTGAKPPHVLLFRLGFFGTTHDVRFSGQAQEQPRPRRVP